MTFWWTAAALAQSFEAAPATVPQGGVVRLRAAAPAARARMGERTVRLFRDGDGVAGLMPLGALDPPGPRTVEFLAADGKVLGSVAAMVRDARFPKQNVNLGKEVAELKAAPGEAEAAEAFRTTVTETRWWAEPFTAPLPGCRTSPYGSQRLVNGKPTGNYHGGVDQRGAAGQPVRAVAAGVVRLARKWTVHGNTVGVDHGQGVLSMYLHLSRFAVEEGSAVKKGDVVGYVGSTGRSTGPHLHWSLYVNAVPVNPGLWVRLQPCGVAKAKAKPRR